MPEGIEGKNAGELAGKVLIVTGAARNIGRAIAAELAAAGAAVVVNALSSRAEAEETVAAIAAQGGAAMLHLADVTDRAQVAAMVEAAIGRFGRIDGLVNNAAVRMQTPFGEIADAQWRHVLSVVLDGAFLCSQACLPHLIRCGAGSIVNIGGETGHTCAVGRAHVVAAKAGLAGLTRAMAHDLAPHGITVNCVVPGSIATRREVSAGELPHRRVLPLLGRRGEPFEVAAMVRMLCGPGARYITGQSVHVNGGSSMY